jgi:hypothetical protein
MPVDYCGSVTETRTWRDDVDVVVDTNIVSQGAGLNEKAIISLGHLVSERHIRVIFPEVVVLEVARHLSEGHRKIRQSIKPEIISRRVLGLPNVGMEDFDRPISPERWEALCREALMQFATVADMPNVPHEELVRRDLRRQAPFKDNGAGYRDALIWETVRDVTLAGRKTVLLTANHRDFGVGSPDSSLMVNLVVGAEVVVLESVAKLESWLDGQGPSFTSPTPRYVRAPVPFWSVVASLDDWYLDEVAGVHFGRRLQLDAQVDHVNDWLELLDAAEYDNFDENTGAFEATILADAQVSASVPRELLGQLDADVSIEVAEDEAEAAVTCTRPVRVVILVQYRLDTREVVDIDYQSTSAHP